MYLTILLWLLLSLPSYIIVFLLKAIFVILSPFLVGLAIIFNAHIKTKSPYFDKEVELFTWSIMKPYQNYEDGIDAGLEFPTAPKWVRILYWTVIRNPVNGFRWLPLVSTKIDPSKIKYILINESGTFTENSKLSRSVIDDYEEGRIYPNFIYFVRQGWYSNFRAEFRIGKNVIRFWIGNFKGYPSHTKGIFSHDYQFYGSGPVFQLKRVKKL
jgi:hypothetical protein